MQATARFHNSFANPILQEADLVFHDSVTFHATNRVFNTNADGGNPTIGLLLRWGQFPSRGCFLGLNDRDPRQEESLEALILIADNFRVATYNLSGRPYSYQRLSLHRCGSRNTRDRSP